MSMTSKTPKRPAPDSARFPLLSLPPCVQIRESSVVVSWVCFEEGEYFEEGVYFEEGGALWRRAFFEEGSVL